MTKRVPFNATKAVREILTKGSRGLPVKITLNNAKDMILVLVRFTVQAHRRAKRVEEQLREQPRYQRLYEDARTHGEQLARQRNALEARLNALIEKQREELLLKDEQINALLNRVGELEVSLQAEQNKNANLVAIGRKEMEVANLTLEGAMKVAEINQGFLELSAMTGRPVEFNQDGLLFVRTVFNGGFES